MEHRTYSFLKSVKIVQYLYHGTYYKDLTLLLFSVQMQVFLPGLVTTPPIAIVIETIGQKL